MDIATVGAYWLCASHMPEEHDNSCATSAQSTNKNLCIQAANSINNNSTHSTSTVTAIANSTSIIKHRILIIECAIDNLAVLMAWRACNLHFDQVYLINDADANTENNGVMTESQYLQFATHLNKAHVPYTYGTTQTIVRELDIYCATFGLFAAKNADDLVIVCSAPWTAVLAFARAHSTFARTHLTLFVSTGPANAYTRHDVSDMQVVAIPIEQEMTAPAQNSHIVRVNEFVRTHCTHYNSDATTIECDLNVNSKVCFVLDFDANFAPTTRLHADLHAAFFAWFVTCTDPCVALWRKLLINYNCAVVRHHIAVLATHYVEYRTMTIETAPRYLDQLTTSLYDTEFMHKHDALAICAYLTCNMHMSFASVALVLTLMHPTIALLYKPMHLHVNEANRLQLRAPTESDFVYAFSNNAVSSDEIVELLVDMFWKALDKTATNDF